MPITEWLPKCLHWPFCPGVFIAILAFVAAAVTFRKEPSKTEKAIWIFVFLTLMCAEVWMMGVDRETNEAQQQHARDEQLKGFKDIGDGISGSIKSSSDQFQATMGRIDTTLKTSERTLRNTQPYATLEYSRMSLGSPPLLMVGSELHFNVYFTNGGNDLAKNPRWDAKSYLGKPDDIAAEKESSIDFDKWWISSQHQGFAIASVRPREPTFFSFKTPAFTDDDLKGIAAHKMTLYILIRFIWSDRTGNWVGDECFSFQDLNHDFAVTHVCRQYHNNTRYRAKQSN